MCAKPKPSSAELQSQEPGGTRFYTLEVLLIGGLVSEEFHEQNPVVSRTIQMRGDQALEELHFAIFDAFGRDEEHLYEFQFGKKPHDRKAARYVPPDIYDNYDDMVFGCVDEVTLDFLELRKRSRFYYRFDFGDEWWHEIKVIAVDKSVPPGKFPKVTERVGENPPQYPEWD